VVGRLQARNSEAIGKRIDRKANLWQSQSVEKPNHRKSNRWESELMAPRESEREGVSVNPKNMMLKNGSMQAVTLAGQALMSAPGDLVITESDTYSGTIAAYKGIGLERVGIPVDADGMHMDLLEATGCR
jgi:DNA-binding transcriptional MocR family regulator